MNKSKFTYNVQIFCHNNTKLINILIICEVLTFHSFQKLISSLTISYCLLLLPHNTLSYEILLLANITWNCPVQSTLLCLGQTSPLIFFGVYRNITEILRSYFIPRNTVLRVISCHSKLSGPVCVTPIKYCPNWFPLSITSFKISNFWNNYYVLKIKSYHRHLFFSFSNSFTLT